MKKFFTLMFAAMLAGQAMAQTTFEINKLKYTVIEGTTNVSVSEGSSYPSGDMTIPSTVTSPDDGVLYTVTTINNNAFGHCYSLTSVTIPSSVTTVGSHAFVSSGLTSITIESDADFSKSSLYFKKDGIEYDVLTKNTVGLSRNVKEPYSGDFVIPDTVTAGNTFSVTSISSVAFFGCELTSLTIPETITKICSRAFERASVEKVTYASVESMYSIEFEDYPLGVVYIGDEELTDLVIPDGVTKVGKQTNKSKLKSVTIPNSVKNLDSYAFFSSGNSIETLIFNINGVKFTNSSLKEINIGDSVTEIAGYAFRYCENLTTLKFPSSVTKIGYWAFSDCTGLTTVIIPKSVTAIESSAFDNCGNATFYCEVESMPEDWRFSDIDNYTVIWGSKSGLYSDEYFTFAITDPAAHKAEITGYNGTKHNVVIPQKTTINGVEYTITTIGERVFESDTTIRNVFIPYTIDTIKSLAFNKNKDISFFCEADYDDDAKPSGWANNWSGNNYSAPVNGNSHINNWFVYQITDAAEREAQIIRYMGEEDTVAIPSKINGGMYTVKSIAGYSFYDCGNLKVLDIPSSVTEIGNYAFWGCDSIETLTYNTDAIGSNFQNRKSLKKVRMGDNVTKIGDWTFSNTGLEEITFSKSVKTVGSSAFSGCSNLKKAEFASIASLCGIEFDLYDSNPLSLAHHLYINGEEVTEVIIPNTVKSIGKDAFSGCSHIELVTIPLSVASVGKNAFLNCSSLTIYCAAVSKPDPGWDDNWNPSNCPVVWGVYGLWDAQIWHAEAKANNSEYGSVEVTRFIVDGTEETVVAKPATGYHFANWSDGVTDNPRIYTVSSDTAFTAIFEEHNPVTDSAIAATCSAIGLTKGSHCGFCDEIIVKQDTIPMIEHTAVADSAVAATCIATGLTEGKHCSVCGAVIVAQTETPMIEHTAVVDSAVAATCTKSGLTEGSHCSFCGVMLVKQTIVDALGHEFVNYVYNNDATTKADGTETAQCEHGCGETETRTAFGSKLTTAISESAADNLSVYAHHNTIIVENATEEIRVYNAMGALVGRDVACRVRAELQVNGAGVYIVKVGNVAKRVMVY
ncbi:MAG: leucine-rich repeat domain-containing protein [Salinivirgaceae bacterium]|nr:leucine-rich repeat domain-containing protein [Salinivirgaceae bacterium]